MEYLVILLWLVGFCSLPANFMMRGSVIALLHKMGKYEQYGAPRGWQFSDALPLKTIYLANLSPSDRFLVRAYFWTWIVALIAIPIVAFVVVFSG
jgi:hypothetical protein